MRDTARRVIAAFHYCKGGDGCWAGGQISAGEGERSGALRQKASDNRVRGMPLGGGRAPTVYILASVRHQYCTHAYIQTV